MSETDFVESVAGLVLVVIIFETLMMPSCDAGESA